MKNLLTTEIEITDTLPLIEVEEIETIILCSALPLIEVEEIQTITI